ncbi:uncharacterized protein EAF02_010325 [Botrytis sinoallii]|uniref:uncharacterized protein n=1 Tax=Botrytis sinoallii TaxID=1463999 RepID=UPI0019015D6A|nr:uncharacterized protein EAF02_010325 [Botrytis sinoallii]KAF7864357.1 hypothetical protein EAF02_010325 [Botrytis sinoallii]
MIKNCCPSKLNASFSIAFQLLEISALVEEELKSKPMPYWQGMELIAVHIERERNIDHSISTHKGKIETPKLFRGNNTISYHCIHGQLR